MQIQVRLHRYEHERLKIKSFSFSLHFTMIMNIYNWWSMVLRIFDSIKYSWFAKSQSKVEINRCKFEWWLFFYEILIIDLHSDQQRKSRRHHSCVFQINALGTNPLVSRESIRSKISIWLFDYLPIINKNRLLDDSKSIRFRSILQLNGLHSERKVKVSRDETNRQPITRNIRLTYF